MRRVLLIIVVLGIFSAACRDAGPIRIGFAGGITGTNSSLAISGRNAVLLAIDEVNREGGINGRPVELVIKDDQEDPERAAAIDKEFLREGVPVVIGHYVSTVAAASLAAIKEQDILMVSPTISARELGGLDDNFLRLILSNTEQGNTLAAYSAGEARNRRSYLVYNNGNKAFVEGVTTAYKSAFHSAGGETVGEAAVTRQDAEGMNAAIEEALRAGADSFLVVMNANDVAIFAQLLKKTGHSLPIYSATWGMTADVIFQGGTAVEGIVFPAMFDSESQSVDFLEFKNAYEQLYGEAVDFSAVYSYEAAQVVFEGIRSAGADSGEAIKRAILDKSIFQGLQTKIILDATGDVARPHFITTIKQGKFLTIGQVE